MQLGKWKNHSQSVDSTSPHGSHAGSNPMHGKTNVTSDSLDAGLGLGSDPYLMDGSPKDSVDKLHDKLITGAGNGVNGVSMAGSVFISVVEFHSETGEIQ